MEMGKHASTGLSETSKNRTAMEMGGQASTALNETGKDRALFILKGFDAYMLKNLFIFLEAIFRAVTIYIKDDALEIKKIDALGNTMVSVRLETQNFPDYTVFEDFPVVVSTSFMNRALLGVKK